MFSIFTKIIPVVLCLAFGVFQLKAITVDTNSRSNLGDFTTGGVRNAPLNLTVNIQQAGEVLYVGVSNNRAFIGVPTLGCPVTLSPTGSVTAITYNGVAVSRYTTTSGLNAIVSPNGCTSVEVFRFVNPPTGAGTLSVTNPAGGDYLVIGAVAMIGASSSSSTANALFSATGTSANASLTVPTTPDDLVLDVLASEFNSLSVIPGNNQTREWRQLGDPAPPPFYVGAGSTKAAGNGQNVMMRWSLQNSGGWALGGVVIQEVVSASSVSVEGRVTDANGRALSRVAVTLTDDEGEKQTAITSPFGYFRFENLRAGQTIVLQAQSKQHAFAPKVLTPSDDAVDVVITPEDMNENKK